MRFETRPLQELIPAEYNPRKKLEPGDPEYQQIRSSISEFGYADPIVINSDGTIIKGHQRCFIMMDMGITEAEVVVLDIPDKGVDIIHHPDQGKNQGGSDTRLHHIALRLLRFFHHPDPGLIRIIPVERAVLHHAQDRVFRLFAGV